MNANYDIAKEYETIKIKSMEENKTNSGKYHKSKEFFVKEKIQEAAEWRREIIEKGKTST
jgi:GrpB-like predicted nucleotidyltransferase (UPF0157 family)